MRCLVVIFLLTDLNSTARALPVLVLLCEDIVGRTRRDFLVLGFVDLRVPLAIGAALVAALMAACFCCACVFSTGTSLLGCALASDLCFLCCL